MEINALQAGKVMGKISCWKLSNLEMQKLLYIAHMVHLGKHHTPLVSGNFEAWDLGPVHPDLYHKAKIFGSSPVKNIFRSIPDPEDGTELDMLNKTIKVLATLPGARLVAITHWNEGAWAKNYLPGARNIIIPESHIRDEYRNWQENSERQEASSSESPS